MVIYYLGGDCVFEHNILEFALVKPLNNKSKVMIGIYIVFLWKWYKIDQITRIKQKLNFHWFGLQLNLRKSEITRDADLQSPLVAIFKLKANIGWCWNLRTVFLPLKPEKNMYLKTVCGNVCQDVSPLSRKRKHGGNLYSRESERLSWKKTLVFKLLSAQAKEELTTNLTGKDPQGGNENINRNPWKQKKKILKGGKTASS